MPTRSTSTSYLSFMLRLWRDGTPRQQRGAGWRASLESSQTQERFVFVSLAELFTFLEQEVDQIDESDCDALNSG